MVSELKTVVKNTITQKIALRTIHTTMDEYCLSQNLTSTNHARERARKTSRDAACRLGDVKMPSISSCSSLLRCMSANPDIRRTKPAARHPKKSHKNCSAPPKEIAQKLQRHPKKSHKNTKLRIELHIDAFRKGTVTS